MSKSKKPTAFTRLLDDEKNNRVPKKERGTVYARLWFGRFAGRTVDQVPSWYLRWLVQNVNDCPDIIEDSRTVLEVRSKAGGMEPPSVEKTVKITAQFLKDGASADGGWTKKQISALGVKWPPRKGWKKAVIGRTISTESAKVFLSLKKNKQETRLTRAERAEMHRLDAEYKAIVGPPPKPNEECPF